MHTPPPAGDTDPQSVHLRHRKHAAAGLPSIAVTMKRSVEQLGFVRTGRTLLRLNQASGFDWRML